MPVDSIGYLTVLYLVRNQVRVPTPYRVSLALVRVDMQLVRLPLCLTILMHERHLIQGKLFLFGNLQVIGVRVHDKSVSVGLDFDGPGLGACDRAFDVDVMDESDVRVVL